MKTNILIAFLIFAGCVETDYPTVDTIDLCKTNPDMCSDCENCPCGTLAVVCCSDEGCISWQNKDPQNDSIQPRTEKCNGTLALCQNSIGNITNSNGENPVTCYDYKDL